MHLDEPIGYAWLKRQYGLPDVPLPHQSCIARDYCSSEESGVDLHSWPEVFWPGETMGDHLQFALKHEGMNLPLLWHLYKRIDVGELADLITRTPGGKYTRKAGFLFDFLTRQPLDLKVRLSGGYVPLLNDRQYLCSSERANARWRVYDNLLGTSAFCPVIEKKSELARHLGWNPAHALESLRKRYEPVLYARATAWLHSLESHAYESIDSAERGAFRSMRFARVLRSAGQQSLSDTLSYESLLALQRAIVDPRGRLKAGLRSEQDYIGLDPGDGQPVVAYPCPPPWLSAEMLHALADAASRCEGLHPVVRAAVLSFGFVYIHPFEDGNGRISRYLIHDSYVRDGLVPPGFIFPISAVIVRRMREYHQALEHQSRAVLNLASYDFDPHARRMRLNNADEVEPLFRYPDLTQQTTFLMQTTRECERVVVTQALELLDRLERAQTALREMLDLPDHRLTLLLGAIHQNRGEMPEDRRKGEFVDLTDDEWQEAERCYRVAFTSGGAVSERQSSDELDYRAAPSPRLAR